MNELTRIQNTISEASRLASKLDSKLKPEELQKQLELTMSEFELSTLLLRRLCEKLSPGVGGYGKRAAVPAREITGSVDKIGYTWLHIKLNTLLPHCRYETPAYFSDTIRRLLDNYEAANGKLPFFKTALLVIDEHSDINGRTIYDQDNKGWKSVSNALKGRVFPDDNQYDLAVMLVSTKSSENVTHITVMDLKDASDFLSMHSGYSTVGDVYSGGIPGRF